MSSPVRGWLRPMRARSADEPHRASTPLEAFFDLCFVVAVSQASLPLHHSIAEHHYHRAIEFYVLCFFAIWWAWMNFTWFASAYDTDDDVYRITTLVQIAGALVLAAGIAQGFDGEMKVITAGYVVMRLAMVAQWLRAARADPQRRATALRYAAGITVVQAAWIVRLLFPDSWQVALFTLLALTEIAVPIWAERAPGGPTTYHRHHIAERYGLFTLIVLGESVATATVAVRSALDAPGHDSKPLLELAFAGLVVVFALWWLYFDRPAHGLLTTLRMSLLWGYGHYFIFGSAAAVGAGLGVAVDHAAHVGEISGRLAGGAVAVPVAVYLFFVWLLHIRPHQQGPLLIAYPIVVVLVLLTPLLPAPIPLLAVFLVALAAVTSVIGRRVPDRLEEQFD